MINEEVNKVPDDSIPKRPLPPQIQHTIVEWLPRVACQGCGCTWTAKGVRARCPACLSDCWWDREATEKWIAKHLAKYEQRMLGYYKIVQGKLKRKKSQKRMMTHTIFKALKAERDKVQYKKALQKLAGADLARYRKERYAKPVYKELRKRIKHHPDVSDGSPGRGGYVREHPTQRKPQGIPSGVGEAAGGLGEADDALLRGEPPTRRWNDMLGAPPRSPGEEPDGV